MDSQWRFSAVAVGITVTVAGRRRLPAANFQVLLNRTI
jgi:hypothetical protein